MEGGFMTCIELKRLAAPAFGVVVMLLAAIPAHALSGDTHLSTCACATTADFVAAAKRQANYISNFGSNSPAGTHVISSTSSVLTAYISLSGRMVFKNGEPVWTTTAAFPVDSNNNSLAGLAELDQETIYNAIDADLMETSRDYPITLGPLQEGQTKSAIGDFFTTSDDLILAGILIDMSPEFIAGLKDGDTITITWQYQIKGTVTATWRVNIDAQGHMSLTFKKATQNNQPITRNGTAIQIQAGGGSSDGSISVSGLGALGEGWQWLVDGPPGTVTIEVPPDAPGAADGGGGGVVYAAYF
jgi:hypothetical protein